MVTSVHAVDLLCDPFGCPLTAEQVQDMLGAAEADAWAAMIEAANDRAREQAERDGNGDEGCGGFEDCPW